MAHHDGHTSVNEVECRFEVHVDNCVPLSFSHAEHQAVFSDTCIVDENIDFAEVCLDSVYHFFSLSEVGSVACITFALYAEGSDFCFCSLAVFVDYKVGECDVGAFFSEFQCDSLANATSGTSNQGNFSFK